MRQQNSTLNDDQTERNWSPGTGRVVRHSGRARTAKSGQRKTKLCHSSQPSMSAWTPMNRPPRALPRTQQLQTANSLSPSHAASVAPHTTDSAIREAQLKPRLRVAGASHAVDSCRKPAVERKSPIIVAGARLID